EEWQRWKRPVSLESDSDFIYVLYAHVYIYVYVCIVCLFVCRFLLCASGDLVKVFSTSTEECVHVLEGHTGQVTGVILNPTNHLQVYSCSADGTIRLWDFIDGILIKATDKKGAKNAFTCVACHPKDDCIATGHEDGKIRLWRNFNQKKEYTYSTQHWHHDAVGTLCFTTEGMHLLSGGVESVLVQWHCEEVNKKDFLPRLGGAISHICVSPDGQMYSTSHLDNKINIIHCSLKLSAVIQGLVKGNIWTDLMIDPRTRALVMNGRPGHLQFYSLQQDKQLYSLDIVQQEYINQEGLDQFEVMRAAFSVGGTWLATVEERGRCTSDLESSLKLWVYNEKAQSFELNTTITAAHQDRIMHMCFSPSTETTMLVTTAWDNQFKVWLLGLDSDTQKEHASWSCDYVGSYHGLQPTNCCFSSDGSLLAVSFKEVVTIWSSDTWELLTTLCQPPGPIRELCFGRLSCSKYLLGTTAKNLFCWNLLTCSLEWSTPMDVCLLRSDPLSENVVAFSLHSGNTDLFVFRPSEPRPLFTQKAVCGGKVQRCVFSPREEPLDSCDERFQWLNRSRLYFLTELMVPLLVDDSVAVTPFYLLLGKHRQQQEEKQNSGVSQAADRVQPPQASVLLHTPAHVLPAASFLCSMFVNSLLISNTGSRLFPIMHLVETYKKRNPFPFHSVVVQMGRYVGWACKDLGLRAVHCRMIYSGILSPSF
uniref:WD repeat-containing protein 75 second beta-propeller domain-containing protein n=1 Tax=Pygocentrus nattereri TaxID=42514 RepID=A0AAR2IXE0_PYGNA